MTSISGKKAEEFLEWLADINILLPPLMTLSEAQQLWERKINEELHLKNKGPQAII